ncbi:MAG: glycosyltransferase [Burkholderiales bacterium]|nr:glycosyltransferase [Burkholderiales bacterium]
MSQEPLVSVIIGSVNGMPELGECLAHLVNQQGNYPYEVIVVDRCGAPLPALIKQGFPQPQVRVVEALAGTSIPKLRAIGMAEARGKAIAILEDHCNVNPHWFETIARLLAQGCEAMGGPVRNGAVKRLTDWAVFFVEYARFMPPVKPGEIDAIAGSSAIYDRAMLDRLGPELKNEVWEHFLHARMRELGVKFVSDPGLEVEHKKEFPFGYFMSQRYHYSRSFAGMRLNGAPLVKRIAYAGATVLLPPLLLWRMARILLGKGGQLGRFFMALPLLLAFMASYAWGEAVGALAGPGNSLAEVE